LRALVRRRGRELNLLRAEWWISVHLHALLVALACVQGRFIGGALYSGWWSWRFGGCWLGFSMGRYFVVVVNY